MQFAFPFVLSNPISLCFSMPKKNELWVLLIHGIKKFMAWGRFYRIYCCCRFFLLLLHHYYSHCEINKFIKTMGYRCAQQRQKTNNNRIIADNGSIINLNRNNEDEQNKRKEKKSRERDRENAITVVDAVGSKYYFVDDDGPIFKRTMRTYIVCCWWTVIQFLFAICEL